MSTRARIPVAIATVLLVFDAPQGKTDVIDLCGAEKDDALRLACFDREVAARRAAMTAAHEPAEGNGAPQSTQLHKARQAQRESGEPAVPVVARVIAVHQVGAQEFTFELDNGQVWRQLEPLAGLEIRVQDSIKIVPGVLGAFFLTTGQKQTFRVKRIR